MAFVRTNTARTCASKAWSTTDLNSALERVLLDQDDLPDDIEKLEAALLRSPFGNETHVLEAPMSCHTMRASCNGMKAKLRGVG